jgi:hypothetical protein
VYDEYWEYQTTITLSSNPVYSIYDNGVIYVAANDVIFKYDNYLNLTKQLNSPGSNRGIFLNPSNQKIYVTVDGTNKINIFDKDLNLNNTLNTAYIPFFITGYKDKMIVTDTNGNIYFYQNDSIIQTVQTQCTGSRIYSVLFDNYNQMLILCYIQSYMYIYHVNGSYTGLSLSTCNSPTFINFDLNDRLVVTCMYEISIYY